MEASAQTRKHYQGSDPRSPSLARLNSTIYLTLPPNLVSKNYLLAFFFYHDTPHQLPSSESAFRLAMNHDSMATSKLAEGIRGFSADLVKLEATVRDRLGVKPAPAAAPAYSPADATTNGGGGAATNGDANGGDKSEFDQLAAVTTIVADTGEIEAIRKYKPTDATTNPSLIYAAAQMPAYQDIVDDAVKHALGLKGEMFDGEDIGRGQRARLIQQ